MCLFYMILLYVLSVESCFSRNSARYPQAHEVRAVRATSLEVLAVAPPLGCGQARFGSWPSSLFLVPSSAWLVVKRDFGTEKPFLALKMCAGELDKPDWLNFGLIWPGAKTSLQNCDI